MAKATVGERGIPQPGQKGGKGHVREREGKGNGPYKGSSGTSGKITRHMEMRVDRRTRIRKGITKGTKWTK
jgi:hypothetical protein